MHKTTWRPTVAAVLLLVAIASCTRPEESIGLGIQPEDDLLGINQIDSVSMIAYTVPQDSLRTDELSHTLVGSYIDPVFGQATASMFTQLRLSANDVDFGDPANILLDSAVLALKLEGHHVGSRDEQAFQVYEIDEQFYLDSSYYTNDVLLTKEGNLVLTGQETVSINTQDGPVINGDTLAPQIRIHLDPVWAQEKFIQQSGTDNISDNTNFIEYFKGIQIQPVSEGAVVSLDMYDAETNMTLYYRDLNGEEVDTTSFVFTINNLCPHFYQMEHLRNGETYMLNDMDTLPATPQLYTQGGSSVYTRIDFPNLDDFNSVEGLIINRAELIIPAREEIFGKYPQPGQLLIRRPQEEFTALLPDDISVEFQAGGVYDDETGAYHFDVSRFVQQSIVGDIEVPSVYIIIEDRFALVQGIVAPSVRRAVLNGPSTSDSDPSKNMRLILTYTE